MLLLLLQRLVPDWMVTNIVMMTLSNKVSKLKNPSGVVLPSIGSSISKLKKGSHILKNLSIHSKLSPGGKTVSCTKYRHVYKLLTHLKHVLRTACVKLVFMMPS